MAKIFLEDNTVKKLKQIRDSKKLTMKQTIEYLIDLEVRR